MRQLIRRKKSSYIFLVLAIFTFGLLSSIIISVPPDFFWNILSFKLSVQYAFFFLLFSFLFFTGSSIFKSKKHGLLIGLFVCIYLWMRQNKLSHPFFLIILIAIFLVLELLLSGRNETRRKSLINKWNNTIFHLFTLTGSTELTLEDQILSTPVIGRLQLWN